MNSGKANASAEQRLGPGLAGVSGRVERPGRRRARVAELLQEALALGVSEEVFAISARTGEGVEALLEHLALQMPQGPFLLAEGSTSDQSQRVLLGELIREAAIRRTRDEVPHALEVVVEEIEHSRGGRTATALHRRNPPHAGNNSGYGSVRQAEP